MYDDSLVYSICGTFVSNLNFHQNYHHAKTSIKLPCPHCPAKIRHQKNLTRHINTVHLKIVEKTCEICGKEFTTNNSYVSHMRIRRDDAFTVVHGFRRIPFSTSSCFRAQLTESGIIAYACVPEVGGFLKTTQTFETYREPFCVVGEFLKSAVET
uniref:C2H2-type domain-containing protein n=1 Tax=Anopheles merus TaxID=30066 RepID=A0A182VBS1_ANOME